jgi:hypothetical protein
VQITHPTRGRETWHPYPYQAKLLMDRAPARLVLKARQTGISQTCAIETAHKLVTQPNATILWLSKDQHAASLILGYVKTVLYGLPGLKLDRDAETFIRLTNGAMATSLPASPTTARSFAASAVYMDEFAFAHYAQEVYQSVYPTVSHGGRLTVISTPNGRANLFFLLWSGQQGGEWSRHTIHWKDCPAYAGDWYERTRPKFTAQSWAQEYECDFVTSGAARFRADNIDRAHDGAAGLGEPQPDREYLTAWDIGRRRDATVGVTLTTTTPYQVVDFERFDGLSYPEIQRRIEARAAKWPGQTTIESNGPGDPVIENLSVAVTPWVTTARSKQQMLDGLSLALERGDLKWRDIPQLDTEMLLYQDDDRDLVQDCVMALGIATAHVGLLPLVDIV